MYIGKLLDALTGLYHFGARFYNPMVGRFITEDSNSGTLEDPMSLTRYVYARDNPMRFTDAGGHATIESDCEDESTCYYGGEATTQAYYAPPSPASLVNPTVVINVAPPPAPPASTTTTTRCASNPDLCLTQSGNNQYASPQSTPTSATTSPPTQTTCQGAPDQCLTQNGNNQYAVTTGGTTSNSPFGPTMVAETGGILATAAAVAGIGELESATALAGGSASVGMISVVDVFGPLALAGVLAFATGYTVGYLIANGNHATTSGAIGAFYQGVQAIIPFLPPPYPQPLRP